MFVTAGPVSRIRRAALQTDNLFEISRREVSMMSTLAVMAGFASHRRHNLAVRDDWGRGSQLRPGLLSLLLQGAQEPDHRSRDPLCRKGLWQRNRQHWLIRLRVPREQARNGCVRVLAGRGRAVLKFRGNGLEECQPGLGQANRGSFNGANSILAAGWDAGTGGLHGTLCRWCRGCCLANPDCLRRGRIDDGLRSSGLVGKDFFHLL